jgi:hypothetical protein
LKAATKSAINLGIQSQNQPSHSAAGGGTSSSPTDNPMSIDDLIYQKIGVML